MITQALPTALQLDLQGELRSCIIAQGDFHLLNTSHEEDDIDDFDHDNNNQSNAFDSDRLPGGGNFGGQDGAFDQVEAGEAFAQRYRQGLGSAPGTGLGLGPLFPSIEEVTAANTALNATSLPRHHQGD